MTHLQKHLKEEQDKGTTFDLDSFGEIMDKFILENDVQMIVTLPAGEKVPKVVDNIGCGPVMTFYLLLNAIGPIFHDLLAILGTKDVDKEKLADALLELVRADMLDGDT